MVNLEKCKKFFDTDNGMIVLLLIDESGSMAGDTMVMIKALNAFFEDFRKFEERGKVSISKATFSSYMKMTDFLDIESFDRSYEPGGGTALYYSIKEAVDNLNAYYEEIVKSWGFRPKVTFVVFSDGEDNAGGSMEETKRIIENLNKRMNANTVFVAFRKAIKMRMGKKMGFRCTVDANNANELITLMGEELSKSCQEQSRSSVSLGSNFYSQVSQPKTGEESGSQTDQMYQILEDDSFFGI